MQHASQLKHLRFSTNYEKKLYIEYTLLYPSTVASFLMPNQLAGSTGSLYREEFIISSGNRLVSFVKGCEEKGTEKNL